MASNLKIFIISIVLCCFYLNIKANENNKVLWGLKATVDVEIPGKWHGENSSVTMYKPGTGFTIGGVSNIYLGKNFYFEPGVSFFYSQYRYDLKIGVDGLFDYVNNPKLYKLGLEVPLILGYTIDFSDKFVMDVFTGPQLRYALGGKTEIKKEINEFIGDTLDLWNVQRKFDCSWKIGIGFPMNQFTLSLEADLGITNLLKHEISFRENRVGLGLSYYF